MLIPFLTIMSIEAKSFDFNTFFKSGSIKVYIMGKLTKNEPLDPFGRVRTTAPLLSNNAFNFLILASSAFPRE